MSFLLQRATVFGLAFGVVLVFGIHVPLDGRHLGATHDAGIVGFAVALAVIGAIYTGRLLAGDVPQDRRRQELVIATGTILAAAAGVLLSPLWLVPGYLGHAIWDALHHEGRWGAPVVAWYPPLCAAVDAVIGVAILVMQFS